MAIIIQLLRIFCNNADYDPKATVLYKQKSHKLYYNSIINNNIAILNTQKTKPYL